MHKRLDHRVTSRRILSGALRVPGDKSVSQRVAMLAGLSQGVSTVRGYLRSEDCLNTLGAVCALGARAEWREDELHITGTAGMFVSPEKPLDLGNSGTGIRLLTGLLAGCPITATLTGDEYLCRRPMERVARPLRLMGAEVTLTSSGGFPPITIKGGGLKGIQYELPMASAQVKSAILLAGLHADGDVVVIEPSATRDYTERMLRQLGVPVVTDGLRVTLPGGEPTDHRLQACPWTVPGDFSSAAFWIAAAAAIPGAVVTIREVGLNPRRTALLDVLRRMGANIHIDMSDYADEEIGTVHVTGTSLTGGSLLPEEVANLIDEIPLLATIACFASGPTEIRGAEELRVKESDRIVSTVTNLRRLGAQVEEFPDGMRIEGGVVPVSGAELDSFGDHRIAMSMAIFALCAGVEARINDTACIATSYPEFWEHYEVVGGQSEHV